MQPAENQQEQEQGQGRIIRMGQAQRPVVVVLALKDTYDEQIMARAEIKMMPMIEAQRALVALSAQEAAAMARGHENCELLSTNTEARARQLGSERIYQLLTGATVTMQPRRRAEDCEHAVFNACGHVVRKGVGVDGNVAPGTPHRPRMTLADYAAQKAAAAAKKAAAADKRARKGETASATPERTPKRRTASGKPRRQREAPKSSETVSTDDETDETDGEDNETDGEDGETDSEDSETDGKEPAAVEPAGEASPAVLASGSRKRKAEAPANGSAKRKAVAAGSKKRKAAASEPRKRKTAAEPTAASARPRRR